MAFIQSIPRSWCISSHARLVLSSFLSVPKVSSSCRTPPLWWHGSKSNVWCAHHKILPGLLSCREIVKATETGRVRGPVTMKFNRAIHESLCIFCSLSRLVSSGRESTYIWLSSLLYLLNIWCPKCCIHNVSSLYDWYVARSWQRSRSFYLEPIFRLVPIFNPPLLLILLASIFLRA